MTREDYIKSLCQSAVRLNCETTIRKLVLMGSPRAQPRAIGTPRDEVMLVTRSPAIGI